MVTRQASAGLDRCDKGSEGSLYSVDKATDLPRCYRVSLQHIVVHTAPLPPPQLQHPLASASVCPSRIQLDKTASPAAFTSMPRSRADTLAAASTVARAIANVASTAVRTESTTALRAMHSDRVLVAICSCAAAASTRPDAVATAAVLRCTAPRRTGPLPGRRSAAAASARARRRVALVARLEQALRQLVQNATNSRAGAQRRHASTCTSCTFSYSS